MAKRKARSVGKPAARHSATSNTKPLSPVRQQAMQLARQAAGLINSGDLINAAMAVERGLQLDANSADLMHLGGQLALHSGDVERGIGLIRSAIRIQPKVAVFHYNLANALALTGELEGALKSFRRALRLNPNDADTFSNMGILLVKCRQLEDAERAFSEAVRLRPDDAKAQLNLAICNAQLRRPEKAEEAIRKVDKLVPHADADLLHQIGNIYRGLGRNHVARLYYERALRKKPQAPETLLALGDVLSRSGGNRKALEVLRELQAARYDLNFVNPAIARILANLGETNEARALLSGATETCGDNTDYLLRIADEYALIGDFDQQESILRKVLALDPGNVDAFHMLAFAPGRKLEPADARRLCEFAEDRELEIDTRVRISFSLGNHFRYAEDYDRSFRYYDLGNRLKGYRFDHAGYLEGLEKVEKQLTREFFAERKEWGSESGLPVLIVGMPRSGTTLLEQVLSAHPQIHGAGEYGRVSDVCAIADKPVPNFHRDIATAFTLDQEGVAQHAAEYLEQMQRVNLEAARFVTNKLPQNFEELGLFGLLFPHAPIIHIKREPRDNLLSVFFHDFHGTHEYAYDQRALGSYYRLYERLMAHWTSVIPNPILELQYEDLIGGLPDKARELAAFLDIAFDDRMLRFYEQERSVKTASRWQVRQPVYTSSIARWKPYARHLKPLFQALELPDS